MSQHPSLRSKGKGGKFRSVLKRFERLKHLKEKEKWVGESSIFGMDKIKILRFKIKKEKTAPTEEGAAGAETPAAGGAAATGAGAKATGAPAAKEAKKGKEGGAKKDKK